MAKLEFYFDLASPYSRIACHRLKVWRKENHAQLECIPVSLTAILKDSSGETALQHKKRMHSLVDLKRAACLYEISDFDTSSSRIQANLKSKEIRLKMIELANRGITFDDLELLYKKYWSFSCTEQKDPITCNQDATKKQTFSSEGQVKLLENTKKAIEMGAFGLPWFRLFRSGRDAQAYFGSDRLEHISLDVQENIANKSKL
ncbi:hypothetical protein MDAP_002730 [Mitosporidium daphniae]|uniref:DSBA oxidoreductase domain-containing protein n=1 Tax=Mitosporidium daphniae TaxID=1485682 RepID=A0A098VRN6_9MICR|nr:DSBA oxidoreductase domain-containing protein [Mitosporidium daphniae]KGG51687.1 DSBA oxidoreductase domain-containing protein [Mitosporidium daphniae]|eukprot:XP_013238145.1 DSBA oxidoreductase domain-containing protein [Mitosporidium daphniae]